MITRAYARTTLWATRNGVDPATLTATYDGADRVVCINASYADAAAAMALADRDVDAEVTRLAALETSESFPDPELLAPIVDATLTRIGLVRIVSDPSGALMALVDQASPRRPHADQRAELVSKRARRAAALAAIRNVRDTVTSGNVRDKLRDLCAAVLAALE